MKLNTIYNCIVLLYLHAFCLLLCFQIEDTFFVELNMGLGIFFYNNSYWDLFLRMLFLSPFIGYYFFKKQEDAESNDFDSIFGVILSIALLLIVFVQLMSCGKDIISFEIPLFPGILCCGVNFLAIGLYYLWNYSQKKFVTTNKVKLFRICNISFLLFSLLYSCILANYYTPYKLLALHHKDKILIQVMDRIRNKEKVFNNIDEFINELSDKKEINNVNQLVQSKHLMYQKIDENKYKLSWKTHLTKQEFLDITGWNNRWHGYTTPSLYEKDNRIVTVEKQKLGDKEMPEELKKVIQAVDKITDTIDKVTKIDGNNVKSNSDVKKQNNETQNSNIKQEDNKKLDDNNKVKEYTISKEQINANKKQSKEKQEEKISDSKVKQNDFNNQTTNNKVKDTNDKEKASNEQNTDVTQENNDKKSN